MTLSEMHVWFRQYAQQMGMQNTLAILPEQIDLLINTSMTDTVNELVRQNIGMTNDRIVTDNSKLGQINALRTLYRVQEVTLKETPQSLNGLLRIVGSTSTEKARPKIPYEDYVNGATVDKVKYVSYIDGATPTISLVDTDAVVELSPTSLSQVYDANIIERSESGTGVYSISTHVAPSSGTTPVAKTLYYSIDPINIRKEFHIPDYLFLVDFSISYKTKGGSGDNTRIFPVRIIDDAYLADTLNDFVLAPRKRSPIITIYTTHTQGQNNTATETETTFDLYFGINSDNVDKLADKVSLKPEILRISYIGKPKPVQYLADVGEKNVDCELPESMHVDILKHAVDLYRISISGSLHANQQQQQQNSQDAARANARPQNEGYV